jgi:hypothetical protein
MTDAGETRDRLSPFGKIRLFLQIWISYGLIRWHLHRRRLPELTARIAADGVQEHAGESLSPIRLGRTVDRVLRIGKKRSRCLHASLVLYRLLRQRGIPGQLVIGLPAAPTDEIAHAWVEVRGRVVGPPPGRLGYDELVRYPESAHSPAGTP